MKKYYLHNMQWKHMTFYKKLLILYCLLVTLLVGCFYTASFIISRETLDSKTKVYMNHIGDLISLKIWKSIDELDTTIQRAVFDTYLTELLSNYNEKNDEERQIALNYTAGKVNQLTSLNPYVEAVDFYFYNGDQWITPHSQSIADVFKSPYFFINNLNQKLEWIDFEKTAKTINGSKILMDSKGRAIALLVVKVNQSFLAELLNRDNITEPFTFYLTNQEGVIISSSNSNVLGSNWRGVNTKDKIHTEREVTVLHWNLFLETPKISFSSYVNQYGKSQIVLILIILFLGFLTSFAMALSISKPIKRLTRRMRRIAEVDLNMPDIPLMHNEIAFFENSFYHMLRRIEELINNVYKETIFRRESELKALQAQINPHFLFNALDLLNWKALMAGQEEISGIVRSLARLMEANLKMDEKTIPIQQEISYIRDYFEIMSKKFGEQIVLNYDIADGGDYYIPKLLLQPLVENAIKHGFQYVKSGYISITVKVVGERLTIRIADNGQGMSSEKLKEIQEKLAHFEKHPLWDSSFASQLGDRDREGVGLFNTYQRLKIIYNDDCTFFVKSKEGEGTVIEMELVYKEGSHVQSMHN